MRFSLKIKKLAILTGLCTMTLMAVSCTREKENNEYADLNAYLSIYNIGEKSGAAMIVDGVAVGNGMVTDGAYYAPYESVREYVDNHYYWDATEKVLTYASSQHIYDAVAGSNEYTVDGELKQHSQVIAYEADDTLYINIDYLKLLNSSLNIRSYNEPERMVVDTVEQVATVKVNEATKLRTDYGAENTIATDLEKGDKLYVIEDAGEWMYAYGEDGIMGYVKSSALTDNGIEDMRYEQSWMDTEPYTYISSESTICLGWHQMEYQEGNNTLSEVTANADQLNVISPTWFKLIDNEGGISSLASKTYVNSSHGKDLQVWGLISDFNYDENNNYYVNQVVSVTSSRRALIDNIMREADICGMDGVNVDFEMIRKDSATGYVQFIRELAIACDRKGLVLSVDMYVPVESNQYYDRAAVGEVVDYLIIMGYDEHWAGCGEAGSVASLPYVKSGIENTLTEIEASRVINAVPFYTRVWYEDAVENAPEGAVIIEDVVNGDYALSSKAVGMGDASELLTQNGAGLRWLEDIGQYYGEYYIDGRLARIWLEDKESLALKLSVMKENNLAGVACWKLGLETEEAWDAIGEYLK